MPHRLTVTRGGAIASVIVIVVAITCVRLGFWQVSRLQEKRARNAATASRLALPPLELTSIPGDSTGLMSRRVKISGIYDDERTVIIAGRALHGSPGVYVLTPLRAGGSWVLVNRGWVPSADGASVQLDSIRETSATNADAVIVELSHDPRAPERDTTTAFRRVWYHASMSALRHQLPYHVPDYIVQLLPSAQAPKYPARLKTPELDEGPHFGYAIQWFSFAVIAVAGWLVMVLRARRREDDQT